MKCEMYYDMWWIAQRKKDPILLCVEPLCTTTSHFQ